MFNIRLNLFYRYIYKLFIIIVICIVVDRVNCNSYEFNYIDKKNDIINNIKDDKLRDQIKVIYVAYDNYRSMCLSANKNKLDEVAEDYFKSKYNLTGQRSIPDRNFVLKHNNIKCISKESKTFKVTVKKGKFGDYNNGAPTILPSNYKFITKDGFTIQSISKIVLPVYKSEIYLDMCVDDNNMHMPEVLFKKTIFNMSKDQLYYNNKTKDINYNMLVTNDKQVVFIERTWEEDGHFRKRILNSIDFDMDYYLKIVDTFNTQLISHGDSYNEVVDRFNEGLSSHMYKYNDMLKMNKKLPLYWYY